MKTPVSLTSKTVWIKSPVTSTPIEVYYVNNQVGTALETYPDSIVIKNLTDIIKQLQSDIIQLRNHVLWVEHTEEPL